MSSIHAYTYTTTVTILIAFYTSLIDLYASLIPLKHFREFITELFFSYY